MKIQIICLIFAACLFALPAVFCFGNSDPYFIQSAKVPDGFSHAQKVELSGRVLPHPRQLKWFEDEFLGFIHYGPNTYTGREWGTGTESAVVFNPGDLDTDQWCELMKAAGMKRVVMVVKHHEGYCLWQTRYTDHSVASSPWRDGRGDVLRDLAQSCEKYGLRLGVYLSPADLYQIESPNGNYGNKSEYTERVIPRPVEGRPFADQRTYTYTVDDYNEYFLNQLFELLTEYGPMYEVWFDGAHPKPGTGQTYTYDAWFDLIHKLAPDAVIFGKGPDIRWCGNEGGSTRNDEYNVLPLPVAPADYHWPDKTDGNIAGRNRIGETTRYFHYYPAETNTSIRHGWFWRNDHEQQVRSADDVFDIYERSVGGNSVFLLNIPPNTEGKFSPRDAEVLREVGRRINATYGTNLLANSRATVEHVLDGNTDTWWQAPSNEASFEVILPEKRTVNRFMICEAIAHRGERIEAHYLEARVDGRWVRVAEGKTVGYKRILRFSSVNADAFRVTITQSRLAPSVAHVSAHYYDEPPKPVIVGRTSEGLLTMGVGSTFSWLGQQRPDQSQDIYFTLDGSTPTSDSLCYEGPVSLPLGGHVRARAIVRGRHGAVSEIRLGIPRNGWTARDTDGRRDTLRVLDGDPQSHWSSGQAESGTQSLTIDMKQDYSISGFTYLPHPTGGFIESYEVHISRDGDTWQAIHQGSFGNIRNDPIQRIVLFDEHAAARYVKLTNLRAPGGLSRVGAAEIEILAAKGN